MTCNLAMFANSAAAAAARMAPNSHLRSRRRYGYAREGGQRLRWVNATVAMAAANLRPARLESLACSFQLRLFVGSLFGRRRESSGCPSASVRPSVGSFLCSRRSIFSPFRDEKDVRPFEKLAAG